MTSPNPTVDYTSRDFASLRQDLLTLAPQFLPDWTNLSDNDFGVVLLDLFAYVGDNLHYYMDRVANEAYLETATKRENVLKIANLLGYKPAGNSAALVTISFTNSDTSDYTVPAGTLLSTPGDVDGKVIYFETDEAILVPASSTANVTAHEGQTVSAEYLGTADGTNNQTLSLFQQPVIDGSVQITVTEAGVDRLWNEVPHLIDAGPDLEVFSTNADASGVVSITFGDNVNGRVPNPASPVHATYRIGGGTRGNVPANLITVIQDNIIPGSISCINHAAADGGADAETTDEIRRNAPASIQGLRRATALNDYALLAVTVPGVARAHAVSDVSGSVLVYIAPVGGGGLDGSSMPTPRLAALQAQTQTFLQAAAPANVTVTVLAPTYVPINISVDVHLLPAYKQTATDRAVKAALAELLSFDNVIFGDLISATDIHLALGSLLGVEYVTITVLDRDSGSGNTTVTLDPDEIPVMGTVLTTMVGGIDA